MGKYMKKAKLAGDVVVKDASQSSLGVRTRAKTLALQRLQPSAASKPDSCYLELRSRRLEKPQLPGQCMQRSQKSSSPKHCLNCGEKGKLGFEDLSMKARSNSCLKSVSIGLAKEEEGCFEWQSRASGTEGFEIEASCGENNLEGEARKRSTRESTPCSLIVAADAITTPGSTTKPATAMNPRNLRTQNTSHRNMPTNTEIEEFFTQAEQSQLHLFAEKYNFDVANELPLPGRYEWERLLP